MRTTISNEGIKEEKIHRMSHQKKKKMMMMIFSLLSHLAFGELTMNYGIAFFPNRVCSTPMCKGKREREREKDKDGVRTMFVIADQRSIYIPKKREQSLSIFSSLFYSQFD